MNLLFTVQFEPKTANPTQGQGKRLIKTSPGGKILHMLSVMTIDQRCDLGSLMLTKNYIYI